MKFRTFLAVISIVCSTVAGVSLAAGANGSYRWDYSNEGVAARKARETALITSIHDRIAAATKKASETEMRLYTNTIHAPERDWRSTWLPDTDVGFIMVPIPGGEFLMGSPETEPGRQEDEGPQHRVKLSPFWMGQCEVTWDEYKPFMLNVEANKGGAPASNSRAADAVSKPSTPYLDMSFGMGEHGFPAIGMTQHAANKYCEWLSAKTGHFYRLPTEAEWEYACRAGTTTAYSFGDSAAKLDEYAWHEDNCDRRYHKVGKKKPNPWGLYDMHGNVAEWCLDQYDPNFYLLGDKSISENPWSVATKRYPHVIRGGAWDTSLGSLPQDSHFFRPEQLRSAARFGSRPEWNTDPLLPQTIWYLDQARFVGFRIVRPLKIPSVEEMNRYWNSEVERGL